MVSLLGDIGTYAWCRTHSGHLAPQEQARFITAVLLETLRSAPRLLLSRLGFRGDGPDPSSYTVPDSVLARRVLEACEHLDPMLVEHGIRTYLFARALGARDGLTCDTEALFAASVLHDYAFPRPDTTDQRCFGFVGASAAAEVLREAALPPETLHAIQDAIALHLNPTVPAAQGVLPHLMHAGVMVDTLGLRSWHLNQAGMERVVARHPRYEFTTKGAAGFRAHALRVPAGRARQAWRCGFGYALHLGPWHAHEQRFAQLAKNA